MKISNQLYITKVADGWNGIYSPFGHSIAFVTESDLGLLRKGEISDLDQELVKYLREKNILTDEDFEQNWMQSNLKPVSIDIDSLYLVTTTKCNIACKYCVVMGNKPDEKDEYMTSEIGLASIRLFKTLLQKNQSEHARVTFYGGEPLLNRDLLVTLIPEISKAKKELNRPIDIVVITNGLIFDEELAGLFLEHHIDLGISVDGMQKHHDQARVDILQKGTYERVIANLKKYQHLGLSVNITLTIGKHNVYDLPEIARYFVEELHVKVVECQIPCDTPGSGNPYWISTEIIAQYLMDAYRVLASHHALECTTYRRMRDFISGKLRLRDCGSSGSQLVVAPDGSMGPCHSLVGSRSYFKGNVLDMNSDPTLLENFIEWANRYPLNMPGCQSCPFISLCGGGCIYNAYIASGSIWGKDPQACPYMKGMVEWLIQNLWQKVNIA